jgi:hypothetical protein
MKTLPHPLQLRGVDRWQEEFDFPSATHFQSFDTIMPKLLGGGRVCLPCADSLLIVVDLDAPLSA